MPILSDIYSAGNTLKRRIGGLLDDPKGSLEQFVGQLRDDMNRNSDLMNQAGWGQIDRVKYTPEQRAAAQKKLADIGTNMAMSAATVWHGSPHKFDKFDASKIGTGEGAQAYGHGLYLAENPKVAGQYQKDITALKMPTDSIADAEVAAAKKMLNIFGEKDGLVQVRRMFGDRADDVVAKANAVTGQLYKVDLPDDQIAKMLDWDKPLSQQAPEVQKALQSPTVTDAIGKLKQSGQLGDYSPAELQQLRGEDWYDMLRQANGDSNAAPSDFLKHQGIPGIRYLDGGSRGTGQGTSNFVVFPGNEGILKILERNGQPLGLLGD